MTATKTKWTIDAGHSDIQFKVKHLMISTASGTFKSFNGQVLSENDDFSNAGITVEIDTNSVSTNQEERDKHLRSHLFFNTEKFPKINFTGRLINNELKGDVTICGVTKPITMAVEFNGIGKGRFNDTRAGFEVNGKLNRKDFGMDFSLLNEAGTVLLGEEVKLNFNIQLVQQAV